MACVLVFWRRYRRAEASGAKCRTSFNVPRPVDFVLLQVRSTGLRYHAIRCPSSSLSLATTALNGSSFKSLKLVIVNRGSIGRDYCNHRPVPETRITGPNMYCPNVRANSRLACRYRAQLESGAPIAAAAEARRWSRALVDRREVSGLRPGPPSLFARLRSSSA